MPADGVLDAAVVADRIVGKPYLEIAVDREAIARGAEASSEDVAEEFAKT